MNILKKQGTAVALTAVMVVIAIVIGLSKAPAGAGGGLINIISTGKLTYKAPDLSKADRDWYVVDGADVLSSSTERDLRNLNEQLYWDMDVVIAVVTTRSGPGDLTDYTFDAAEDMELAGYDFIVALDIAGDDYCLVQGAELIDVFTDDDCYTYARRYMETPFADGDYDEAVLELAQALSQWYYANYTG